MRAAVFGSLTLAIAPCLAQAQAPPRLTLEQAQQMAVRSHPSLGAARSAAAAASEIVTETRSAYFPVAFGSLTGGAALPNSRIAAGALNNPVIYNRYSDGLTVGQLITDFGRTQNLVASARLRGQAAEERVALTREDVILRVTRSYFGVLRQQAVLKVAQDTVNQRQLMLDQVTTLANSKLKSTIDVSFASVNLSDAKLLLAQAEGDLQAAWATLADALGSQDQQTFELSDAPLPAQPAADVNLLISQALKEEPGIAAQRLNASAAQRFARAERDLWMPTVSSIAAGGFTPLHVKALADRYGAVGMNVNIPIFNGRLFSARRAEAEDRAKTESQTLTAMQNRVARDVRIAWLNANTAFQRIALTDELQAQAKLALELADTRYRLGLGSIVELSQAQLNLTQALIQQAGAKYEYQIATAILNYQMGRL